MKFSLFLTGLLAVILGSVSFSQDRITVDEYIELYKDIAIEEMKKFRIPASITLAQGILESESGNSPLAVNANNHFGIKCHKEWTGKTYFYDDDEKNECFRVYENASESYYDHSYFLTTRDRYKLLFDLEITDYKGWAQGLKQAGYATNPRYPELLIKIIEENGLEEYDRAVSRQSSVVSRQSSVVSLQSSVSSQQSAVGGQNTNPEPEFFAVGPNDRVIFRNNGVKYVMARKGDDCEKIAAEFGIYSWQLYFYNDFERNEDLEPGEIVYLEKKRGRGEEQIYKVGPGDDLHSVSQALGIRLKALCRLNGKEKNDKLKEGETLILW
jgi:LysM repeat protein